MAFMPRVQDSERKHLIAFPGGVKGQTPHDGPNGYKPRTKNTPYK